MEWEVSEAQVFHDMPNGSDMLDICAYQGLMRAFAGNHLHRWHSHPSQAAAAAT